MMDQMATTVLIRFADALSNSHKIEDGLTAELASIIRGTGGDEGIRQQVLEMLADAARQISWRDIFGQVGLLAACSTSLHPEEPENTLKQKLRLIGNCCADNDSNRDIIIETGCYEKLVRISATAMSLRPLAMVVMFNFMNEYEPAQKHAFEHGLIDSLAGVLKDTDKQLDSAIDYALRCLELVLQLDITLDDKSGELITSLLDWATCPTSQFDVLYITLGCLSALHKEEYTKGFSLDPSPISKYLTLMARLQYWENKLSQSSEPISDDIDPEDAARLIRSARSTVIATISDISAYESFQTYYPPGSPLFDSVVKWLASNDTNFLTCASLILGNMARDAEACHALVHKYQIHTSLINLLKEQNQIGVLHAAGGALKNLIIGSPEIRESVVEAGIFEYCHKFYLASVMIEVQHMGLSLVRILVATSPKNAGRLLLPFEGDPGTSAMDQILELYAKNTEAPIRMEIGRIVVSILREAAKTQSTKPAQSPTQQRVIAMSPGIIEPVIDMIVQEKWPVIASEGWFALALCVQTIDGAKAVSALTFSEIFFRALRQAIMQPASSTVTLEHESLDVPNLGSEDLSLKAPTQYQKDRENVYMFLSGLLKNDTCHESQPSKILFRRFLDGQEVTDAQIKEAVESC